MAIKVEVTELRTLKASLDNVKSEYANDFNDLKSNLLEIQDDLSNFTASSLNNTHARLISTITNMADTILLSIDECSEFLDKQMLGYEITLEDAYTSLQNFVSGVATAFGVSFEIPSYSTGMYFYEIKSPIQEYINGVVTKTKSISNTLVSYQYILNSVGEYWISTGEDKASVCSEIQVGIDSLNNTILPLLNKYTEIFNNLVGELEQHSNKSIGNE